MNFRCNFVSVTLSAVTGNDAIRENFTFIDLYSVAFLLLHEHLQDTCGTNLAISKLNPNCFQSIKVDIHLRTHFPDHNPPVREEVVLFISWFIRCVGLPG